MPVKEMNKREGQYLRVQARRYLRLHLIKDFSRYQIKG